MVITETGAAKAVAKVLPQLDGKLTGNVIACRHPMYPWRSSIDIGRSTTRDELNEFMRETALHSDEETD